MISSLASSFAAATNALSSSPAPSRSLVDRSCLLPLRWHRRLHNLSFSDGLRRSAKKASTVPIAAAYATEKSSLDDEDNSTLTSSGSDMFVLDLAEKLEESEYVPNCTDAAKETLSFLRETSAAAVVTSQWPSNKDEAYRFTDIRFLKKSVIEPCPLPSQAVQPDFSELNLASEKTMQLVFVDGVIPYTSSNLQESQGGVIFGSISSISDEIIREIVMEKLVCSAQSTDMDIFASLNGIGARDLGVVIVPEGLNVQDPLHIIYLSSQGDQNTVENAAYSVSCPRLLILVGKGSELHVVEEFVGDKGKLYWNNSVVEIYLDEDAQVRHSYVQNQGGQTVHIKQTSVTQKERSNYQLVEAEIGSRLSRHNLHIKQLGPETITNVSSFLLSGQNQLQDLHSKLILSHPRGYARQLHKCIVMHSSGHCVFDGNIKVNRYAQQTDAGQLSRSLLLAPRATVNVKPNLQIIADDVKCSHGAAISDLEDDQIFYFQARGIDPQTARNTLVFSFGAEVLQRFEFPNLQRRIEGTVRNFLRAEGAVH